MKSPITIGRWLRCLTLPILAASLAGSAWATSYTVTTTADDPSNTGSLRYVVNDLVDKYGGSHTITFAPGINEIILDKGQLKIGYGVQLTINGPGVIIRGHSERIFEITGAATLRLNGLTLAGGTGWPAPDFNKSIQYDHPMGGAIYNSGELYADGVNFEDNGKVRASLDGGAIYNDEHGKAVITNSSFKNNGIDSANLQLSGGAIYNSGYLWVTNSSFFSNGTTTLVPVTGGAIYNLLKTYVANVTFSGNGVTGYPGTNIYNEFVAVTYASCSQSGLTIGSEAGGTGPVERGTCMSVSVEPPIPNVDPGGVVEVGKIKLNVKEAIAANALNGQKFTLALDQGVFSQASKNLSCTAGSVTFNCHVESGWNTHELVIVFDQHGSLPANTDVLVEGIFVDLAGVPATPGDLIANASFSGGALVGVNQLIIAHIGGGGGTQFGYKVESTANPTMVINGPSNTLLSDVRVEETRQGAISSGNLEVRLINGRFSSTTATWVVSGNAGIDACVRLDAQSARCNVQSVDYLRTFFLSVPDNMLDLSASQPGELQATVTMPGGQSTTVTLATLVSADSLVKVQRDPSISPVPVYAGQTNVQLADRLQIIELQTGALQNGTLTVTLPSGSKYYNLVGLTSSDSSVVCEAKAANDTQAQCTVRSAASTARTITLTLPPLDLMTAMPGSFDLTVQLPGESKIRTVSLTTILEFGVILQTEPIGSFIELVASSNTPKTLPPIQVIERGVQSLPAGVYALVLQDGLVFDGSVAPQIVVTNRTNGAVVTPNPVLPSSTTHFQNELGIWGGKRVFNFQLNTPSSSAPYVITITGLRVASPSGQYVLPHELYGFRLLKSTLPVDNGLSAADLQNPGIASLKPVSVVDQLVESTRVVASGTARQLKLTGYFVPPTQLVGQQGSVYFFIYVPQAMAYWTMDSNLGWNLFTDCSSAKAYYSGPLRTINDIPIIPAPVDLSAFSGTQLFIGYGQTQNSCEDMLNRGTYSWSYTIPY